jgi:hypothetical protein
MPIRPENVDRYPPDWPAIAAAIKWDRAGGRCECAGECGRPAEHLAEDGRCPNRHGAPAWGTGKTVVLTTAHLDHQPENSDPSNLLAACSGCHLFYDRHHHARTRAATRIAALGMDALFELELP